MIQITLQNIYFIFYTTNKHNLESIFSTFSVSFLSCFQKITKCYLSFFFSCKCFKQVVLAPLGTRENSIFQVSTTYPFSVKEQEAVTRFVSQSQHLEDRRDFVWSYAVEERLDWLKHSFSSSFSRKRTFSGLRCSSELKITLPNK